MSSTLLLTSHSLRDYISNHKTNIDDKIDYKFILIDPSKNPSSKEYTQDWTHLIPKEKPYIDLKEGDTFKIKDNLHNNDTYKVKVVKKGQSYVERKYFHVWFIKI